MGEFGNDEDRTDGIVSVHQSRISGKKIPSHSLIDTTHSLGDARAHYLLLKSNGNRKINRMWTVDQLFMSLTALYKERALEMLHEMECAPYRQLDGESIGRFMAFHIVEYLCGPSGGTDIRFMIQCLIRNHKHYRHGLMRRWNTRRYIID